MSNPVTPTPSERWQHTPWSSFIRVDIHLSVSPHPVPDRVEICQGLSRSLPGPRVGSGGFQKYRGLGRAGHQEVFDTICHWSVWVGSEFISSMACTSGRLNLTRSDPREEVIRPVKSHGIFPKKMEMFLRVTGDYYEGT